MDRSYDPWPGIGRFLAGTPPILDLAAVEEGVKLTAEAGIGRLRHCVIVSPTTSGSTLGFELGRRATRRAAARTSRSGTPRRGRSPAR